MITAVIFFLAIMLTIVGGVSFAVLRQVKNAHDFIRSKESYYLSEGGMEDLLYRVKAGKNYSSAETLILNNYSTVTTVSDVSGGKLISASTNRDGDVRKISANISIGTGESFNYGVQTGQGGFDLQGGSRVNGNVYANGSITGDSATITGSATAANSSSLAADQTNNTPTTPANSITFRNASASQDFAQSFQVSTTEVVNKTQVYIKKFGSPSNVTVRIVEDNNGVPSGAEVTNTTISSSLITTNYAWVDALFPSGKLLVTGTTYWLVLDSGSQSSSNYYIIAANAGGYSNGTGKVGTYGGTWNNTSPAGLDGYFVLYLGGQQSTIGGTGSIVVGSGGVGDAWAHNVQGVQVAGSLYCASGNGNNKSCDTSRGDPAPQPLPVSQGNIDSWKAEATAGGINSGDLHFGSAGGSLGPKEIDGDLTIGGGGTVIVKGTLWVTGNLSLAGGSKIVLDSSYGASSGVIVIDGTTSLTGGSDIKGTGQAGSYILILSTSDCPTSLSCSGNPAINDATVLTSAVLNAQNGTIAIAGGSHLKEATAYRLTVAGGSVLTYDSGLVNMHFKSGPSGGWNISGWSETQ